jgi:hypothetical protein
MIGSLDRMPHRPPSALILQCTNREIFEEYDGGSNLRQTGTRSLARHDPDFGTLLAAYDADEFPLILNLPANDHAWLADRLL